MAVYRVPLLIWEDFRGNFSAQAVMPDETFLGSSFAATRNEAIAEVKAYLQWYFETMWWRQPAEFNELALTELKIELRPEYRSKPPDESPKKGRKARKLKERVHAVDDLIPIRVACVWWKTDAGGCFASLPMLEIEFSFNRPEELKEHVTAKVREALRGSPPLAFLNHLPPKKFELEELKFTVRQREVLAPDVKESPSLSAIAEPLTMPPSKKSGAAKIYERDAEIEDLVRRFQTERASILLVGESGVGKTATLAEAARRIEKELLKRGLPEDFDIEYDEADPRHRFWMTSGGRVIAGMKYLGEWEQRLENVIGEIADIDGVLCVENLLDLIRVGGRGPEDSVAAFLMPYVQRGEIRIVAEATKAELDACRRLLPGFAGLFQIVPIPEFTAEKSIAVLSRISENHARNLNVAADVAVIKSTHDLFRRFMPYRKFPGRTVAFFNRLFTDAAKERRDSVSANDVIDAFLKLTGLPELILRDEVTLDFEDVVSELSASVIGQPRACREVAHIVTTFKAGLNDPQRPLGVFLFAGPTGVGKTELAKSLARFFFGAAGDGRERLVRLDMSEYGVPGSASRLLTKPNGDPSEMIREIRERPFSVVLLDEIEKADAQVFDVLLGLFDEGRLTDHFGRVTNFTSSVVIMTSNLGAERLARGDVGFGETATGGSERDIRDFFRPEFFNRLDGVIRFEPLGKRSLLEITEKELRAVARREGLTRRGIRLVWDKSVVEFLARRGFDKRFGARPLQRTVEAEITSPLAALLITDDSVRDRAIRIRFDGEKIVFASE